MRGTVGFEDYEMICIIGVNPEERVQPQPLYIDLMVETDFSRCVKSDRLEEAVDYRQLIEVCHQIADRKPQLIERFAGEVLEELLAHFDISWAWIKVKKPRALPDGRYPFVELERFRDQP
jgi:dihydroneopterin aldolase